MKPYIFFGVVANFSAEAKFGQRTDEHFPGEGADVEGAERGVDPGERDGQEAQNKNVEASAEAAEAAVVVLVPRLPLDLGQTLRRQRHLGCYLVASGVVTAAISTPN